MPADHSGFWLFFAFGKLIEVSQSAIAQGGSSLAVRSKIYTTTGFRSSSIESKNGPLAGSVAVAGIDGRRL